MGKKSLSTVLMVTLLISGLTSIAHASESDLPVCPKMEDGIKEILQDLGIYNDENFETLKHGGSLHISLPATTSKTTSVSIILPSGERIPVQGTDSNIQKTSDSLDITSLEISQSPPKGTSEVTSPTPTIQQPRLETSLVGGPNGCCYVLKSNGELWAYSPGLRFWESESSVCVLKNVSAVATCNRGYKFILQKDGTLLKSDGIKFKSEEIEFHDSDVCQIGNSGSWGLNSGLCYLKQNGNLYVYHETHDSEGKLVWSNELLAENVICFADKYTYITSDHVLHYVSNYVGTDDEIGKISTSTANGFQDLYHKQNTSTCFALSDTGDLYAWGDNSNGQVGCGAVYDYTSVQLIGPKATDVVEYWRNIGTYVQHPTKIMEDIETLSNLYISDASIYARDKSGDLWKWGDAPKGAQVLCSGGFFYVSRITMPDAYYCFPRKSSSSCLFDNSINGFIFKTDGSIYKEDVDINLQHISILLPFTLTDIAQNINTSIIADEFTDVYLSE